MLSFCRLLKLNVDAPFVIDFAEDTTGITDGSTGVEFELEAT
jgi:hypothetical protein